VRRRKGKRKGVGGCVCVKERREDEECMRERRELS